MYGCVWMVCVGGGSAGCTHGLDWAQRLHRSVLDALLGGISLFTHHASHTLCLLPCRQLQKILQDFGPHLTAGHLASAIALLAGMAAGKQLPAADMEGRYLAPARRCAQLLHACVEDASPVDAARWACCPGALWGEAGLCGCAQGMGCALCLLCTASRCLCLWRGSVMHGKHEKHLPSSSYTLSHLRTPSCPADAPNLPHGRRAAYGLARLRIHDPQLLSLLVESTQQRLDSFSPEALAGLLAGLAAWRHVPPPEWLQRFSVASFACLSTFTAQELANCMYAYAQLGVPPSVVWGERALQLFRGCWGRSGCHAPSVVKFGAALARLGLRPGFNWMAAYLREARRQVR